MEHEFSFSIYWECHHSNWLSLHHFSVNHQPEFQNVFASAPTQNRLYSHLLCPVGWSRALSVVSEILFGGFQSGPTELFKDYTILSWWQPCSDCLKMAFPFNPYFFCYHPPHLVFFSESFIWIASKFLHQSQKNKYIQLWSWKLSVQRWGNPLLGHPKKGAQGPRGSGGPGRYHRCPRPCSFTPWSPCGEAEANQQITRKAVKSWWKWCPYAPCCWNIYQHLPIYPINDPNVC